MPMSEKQIQLNKDAAAKYHAEVVPYMLAHDNALPPDYLSTPR